MVVEGCDVGWWGGFMVDSVAGGGGQGCSWWLGGGMSYIYCFRAVIVLIGGVWWFMVDLGGFGGGVAGLVGL